MSEFKILPCAKRWNYPSVDLTARMVRTCVRGFGPVVGKEDLEKFGTDVFLNHPYMKRGRELMLKGQYQWDCRGCYEYAKAGGVGFRTPHDETLEILAGCYGEDVDSLRKNFARSQVDQKYLVSQTVKELEVGLGNLCDMKCLYCTSDWSSMIEAEERELGGSKNIYHRSTIEENKDFVDAFWKWMEETALLSLENIHLIGGETLFNRYFYVFVEKLDGLYRSLGLQQKITVNVFSNLNNESTVQRFLKLLKDIHPRIVFNLTFSCEAIGPKAEFIRSGLSWERAMRNVEALLADGRIVLSFAPSFNNISLTSALDYLKFVRAYGHRVGQPVYVGDNNISHPTWLSPHILTREFIPVCQEVRAFLQKEGDDFLDPESRENLLALFSAFEGSIRKNNENEDFELLKARRWFYRSILDLQKRRNVSFTATFPEYKSFLIKCKEAYLEGWG